MQRQFRKLFPQIVGVYTNDQHSFPMEKLLVDKCYDLKKTIEPGGKNWISQTVYNTEGNCNLNNELSFDQVTNFFKDCALDYCKELNYQGVIYLLHTDDDDELNDVTNQDYELVGQWDPTKKEMKWLSDDQVAPI